MKSVAAVAVSPLTTEIKEFEVPTPASNEAVLRVELTGVCSADWGYYQGHSSFVKFPLVLGHETVGRIAAAGDEFARRWNLNNGDRIVVEEILPCFTCAYCMEGKFFLCLKKKLYGTISSSVPPALWGGYSQFMYLHPNSIIHRLPEEIPAKIATLFIPLSNGLNWVTKMGELKVGETVVIQGAGQHALGCVAAAKVAGAGKIILIGLTADKERLELAKRLGANATIISDLEDPVSRVNEITSGELADLVVDVTGSAEAFAKTVQMIKRGGKIVTPAFHRKPIPVDIDTLVFKAARIQGVLARDTKSVDWAISILGSNTLPFDQFATHEFPLSQVDRAIKISVRQIPGEVEPIHVDVNPWQ